MGAVRMTASQSQASSKRIRLAGAFCSIPRITTASGRKSEKRKAAESCRMALLAKCLSTTARFLTVGSFHPEIRDVPFNTYRCTRSASLSLLRTPILSAFPSTVSTGNRRTKKKLAARATFGRSDSSAGTTGVIYVRIDKATHMVGQRD